MSRETTQGWPKVVPPLTPEQRAIADDFMKRWHEILPARYGRVERFNHGFVVEQSSPGFTTTLEVGAGLGEHLRHERLTAEQQERYVALELRENMAAELRRRFPAVEVIVGDCQDRLPFPDGYFDRYLAIHVLEHLPNLPACVEEAHRLLDKERGRMLVVIPCEGSPAYTLARRVSAQRIFERTYGVDYSTFVRREHINRPHEILDVLRPHFTATVRRFFPLRLVPATFCNLCIGLVLRPRSPVGEAA